MKTKNHIKELISDLAMREWYARQLKRLRIKPTSGRMKCCMQEFGFLSRKIYPVQGQDQYYLDILMTMCTGCGNIYYWVEWPDEDVIYRSELKSLQDTCDDALKGLL